MYTTQGVYHERCTLNTYTMHVHNTMHSIGYMPWLEKLHRSHVQLSERLASLNIIERSPETLLTITAHYCVKGYKGAPQWDSHDAERHQPLRQPMEFFPVRTPHKCRAAIFMQNLVRGASPITPSPLEEGPPETPQYHIVMMGAQGLPQMGLRWWWEA